jgi:hypothetical protein
MITINRETYDKLKLVLALAKNANGQPVYIPLYCAEHEHYTSVTGNYANAKLYEAEAVRYGYEVSEDEP